MKVNCPTCQKSVIWSAENQYRPFCCKQCQLIDLGEWANESHTIPAAPQTETTLAIDPEEIEALLQQQEKPFFSN
jgi:endogenous inhibitor of DNA gyrase (YacG/DUF329 family)